MAAAGPHAGSRPAVGRPPRSRHGLAVALTALRLQTMPPGVWHLDQVVDAQTFLTELTTHGFDLELELDERA